MTRISLSALPAAAIGSLLGDWAGGSYGWRAGGYSVLLVYVITGAIVLFVKVARYETQRLNLPRLLKWLASLWLWPLLLFAARGRGDNSDV